MKEKNVFFRGLLLIFLMLFFSPNLFSATENLSVDSCSEISGSITIANCTGLNTSDDDQDVVMPKSGVLGANMTDTSSTSGTINSVTVTVRHSGEESISETLGITMYDATNHSNVCTEDTSISNTSSFQTDSITACTPSGGWTTTLLDNLQVRVKNNDDRSPQDAFLSYLLVTIDYTIPQTCGNNLIEGTEACDGTDLDSQTCVLQGFDSGDLACEADCTAFDTSSCVTSEVCGNGTVGGPEACDGENLANQTCASQGFESGTISCASDCLSFVTTSCVSASPDIPGGVICGTGCCGSGTCDSAAGEDYGTCRADCKTPTQLIFTQLKPTLQEVFSQGEEVIVEVELKADSVLGLSALEFTATGDFGTIELKDNGEAPDANAGDGIYSSSFIAVDLNGALLAPITFSATVAETSSTDFSEGYNFSSALEIGFETSKNTYYFGDVLKVNGGAFWKGASFQGDLNFFIFAQDGNLLHESIIKADKDGVISLTFQISTLHPQGEWGLKIFGTDDFNHFREKTKKVTVVEPKETAPVSIVLIDKLIQTIERGKRIKLTLKVRDEFNEHVDGAKVLLVAPNQQEIVFEETINKTYSAFYTPSFELERGEQEFVVIAEKRTPLSFFNGSQKFFWTVNESELNLELIEPKQLTFKIGEEIPIKVRVTYKNDAPVLDSQFNAKINNQEIVFTALEQGVFTASYLVRENDAGNLALKIEVEDKFKNFALAEHNLFVEETLSLSYYARKYPVTIGVIVLLALSALGVVGFLIIKHFRLKDLEKKLSNLTAELKALDKSYFESQTIKREVYSKNSARLNSEIESIKKRLEKMKKRKLW